ncbi:hypothetical protein U1Q18_047765, partial [Sarracenia purpurea var. burkii]
MVVILTGSHQTIDEPLSVAFDRNFKMAELSSVVEMSIVVDCKSMRGLNGAGYYRGGVIIQSFLKSFIYVRQCQRNFTRTDAHRSLAAKGTPLYLHP